ncbi:MAG: PVC-type heme-binding CxxCH protein [Pirellulaceae bacterium]
MALSRIHLLGAAVFLSLTGSTLAQPADVKSPLSPEDSLKHFQLDPLLSIELVAAEPEVVDPVAMRFDEDGRLWVAEMRDYPLGPIKKAGSNRTEKDAEPLSQIKILDDKDGDGRFETATVFADKLLFVTGLQPWKGGAIVTLSGKVAYMKDTDGDSKADLNETWFTGFSEANSQLRANHPTFALDNHIYIANGLRGGMVVNHLKKLLASGGRKPPDTKSKESGDRKQKTDDAPINISGMDFRFDPLTGEAEAVSGNGQFGLCFDDWGNRFVCSNRNPCQHVVIENRYLKKAPTVAVPSVVQDVAAFAENSRIYPISKFWTTSNLHEGQFTAACGVFIYRGDLLPKEFRGNVFTCDPTGNLIHREVMEPKGATFTSKPAYEGKEFLASPDTWFRPVGMELGPDGALYVVDMYRAVIEHPEWVPDELKNRPDERLGDDRGRIYRIVPSGSLASSRRAASALGKKRSQELVKELENANAWRRESAQRVLLERQDPAVTHDVENMVFKSAKSYGRIHAMHLLVQAGIPDPEVLKFQIDGLPPVRRHLATLLDGSKWAGSDKTVLQRILVEAAEPAVRFHGLLTSAGDDLSLSQEALGKIAIGAGNDPWSQRAILITAAKQPRLWLEALVVGLEEVPAGNDEHLLGTVKDLAYLAGSTGTDVDATRIVEFVLDGKQSKMRRAATLVLTGLGQGLARRAKDYAAIASDARSKERLHEIAEQAKSAAQAPSQPIAERLEAVDLLAVLPGAERNLIDLSRCEEVVLRVRVLSALSRQAALEPWSGFIEKFSEESPLIRQAILDGVFQRPERIALLLSAMEASRIRPSEFDPVQAGRLLKHGDAKIRERAEKIFGSATPEDRKKALADYQSVLTMTGDARRGQVSFAKNCATCHKIGETGVNVAPDISDSRTKTPSQILADIIQPNRAIDANYVGYNLLLTDGTTAAGILTSETSTSITLKAAGAKVITVARGEIEQLKSTGVSLMPDGLEKTIPPQEMADVIAFIKNWRYLDGRVPLK